MTLAKVGIVGYGAYVPRFRIKAEEIAKVWGKDGKAISSGLGLIEKSVPDIDEDAATIAVEAARNAVKHAGIDPNKIGAVYVGSESHPYAVKPTATIVIEALGISGKDITAADYEFACKAGTAAIQTNMGLVQSGMIEMGLAIGADTSQGRPGDALEFSAAAGGAAFIIGKEDLVAEIQGTYSFTTDTPDFWRREGADFPKHGARFTGKPAYFRHITEAAKGLMEKMGTTPEDYDFFVPHQPNGKFPMRVSKMLGFPKEKVEPSLMVRYIGNTYSGSSVVGLSAVLDIAKPGQRILMTSFGSGAGSDAFDILVTDKIEEKRGRVPTVKYYVDRKKYIDYGTYVKNRRKLKSL